MIGSAVITLEPNSDMIQTITQKLSLQDAIETGNLVGCRLPITMEAETPASLESLTRWIQQLDGVLLVDVAFISLDDTQSSAT